MLSVELLTEPSSPTPLQLKADIRLDQGIVGVMGPSGCGKTTLLRVLAGLETRYQGQISLSGQLLWSSEQKVNCKPELRNIGLVFQDARLFSHLTVAGNLAFALKRACKALFTIDQVVQWFGLSERLNSAVSTLSGGERQRVAVARAVIHSPTLLLLDEPFVALDLPNRLILLNSLKQLYVDTRLPMIFVSHDINDIRQLCRQLILLDKGQINQQGETFHLLNQLETGLTLAQPVAATVLCRLTEAFEDPPLTHLQLGNQQLVAAQSMAESIGADFSFEQSAEFGCELGAELNCLVNATDISIGLSPIIDCSMANCLQVKVDNISWLDQQNVVVKLGLSEQLLYAQITGYSLQRLGLKVGMTVYALFKASAVKVLGVSLIK